MTRPATSIPENYQAAIPMLAVREAAGALVFHKAAFDATEESRLTGPDGKITCSDITIGAAQIMVADEFPGAKASRPTRLAARPSSFIFLSAKWTPCSSRPSWPARRFCAR